MDKTIKIQTIIKNSDILNMVLKKLDFILETFCEGEIPPSLGDPTLIIGLIKDCEEIPVCYLMKYGNWYTLITSAGDDTEEIRKKIGRIRQEYAWTKILKISLKYGWNTLSRCKVENDCQIELAG